MDEDFESLKDEIEKELDDYDLKDDYDDYSKQELKDLVSELYDELKRKDQLLLDMKEKLTVLTDMVVKRSDRMIDLQEKVKKLNRDILESNKKSKEGENHEK